MTDRPQPVRCPAPVAAMPRRLAGGRLVIASHNPGKRDEIAALLAPFGIDAVSAGALGLAEPEETGATFIANARLKAELAAKASGLPALADDSGLAVAALGGQPGIYSARWALSSHNSDRDFGRAMRRIAEALEYLETEDRRARFVCALALAWPDGHVECFEGSVEGILVRPPRGSNGFGYDPVFQPAGFDITFSEMDPMRKHAMSHRADAFRQLVAACFGTA
ncbi:MAG: RdgB/HAM1 family non-canonical purine NTP pyrophosphatase [Rhodospirillaceae bacterium]|nr:RdgB/HAM1 family non-canonical purine NTP pyrophosphatase [Rhodospirillaceae bacterium]